MGKKKSILFIVFNAVLVTKLYLLSVASLFAQSISPSQTPIPTSTISVSVSPTTSPSTLSPTGSILPTGSISPTQPSGSTTPTNQTGTPSITLTPTPGNEEASATISSVTPTPTPSPTPTPGLVFASSKNDTKTVAQKLFSPILFTRDQTNYYADQYIPGETLFYLQIAGFVSILLGILLFTPDIISSPFIRDIRHYFGNVRPKVAEGTL
jgi:hypothetical protein